MPNELDELQNMIRRRISEEQTPNHPVLKLKETVVDTGKLDELKRQINVHSAATRGDLIRDLGPNIDTESGMSNPFMRIALSYIDDPAERVGFLKKHGYAAGRAETGDLVYLNPESKKWTLVDERKATLQDFGDWFGEVPETALQTLGAMGGSLVKPGLGTIVGAGAGTAAGQYLKRGVANALTGAFYRPTPVETGIAVAGGMLGEKLGRMVAKPIEPKITPKAEAIIQNFKQFGGRFLPAQISRSRGLWVLQNFLEGSWGGAQTIGDVVEKGQGREVIDRMVNQTIRAIGNTGDPHVLGTAIQDAAERGLDSFMTAARANYAQLDGIAQKGVSTRRIKDSAKQLLNDLVYKWKKVDPNTGAVIKGKAQITGMNVSINTLQKILGWPAELPWRFLQQERASLYKVGYRPNALVPGRDAGIAKKLANKIDEVMETEGNSLDPQAVLAWREANKFYKEGIEIYNDKLLTALSKEYPDSVAKYMTSEIGSRRINHLKQILPHDVFQDLKAHWLNDIIHVQSVTPQGNISWRKLNTQLNKVGDYNLEKMFSKDELQSINNIARTLELIQERPTKLGGGLVVQLVQSGAIISPMAAAVFGERDIGEATQGALLAGGAVLISTKGLAKIYASKAGMAMLARGLTTNPTTPEAVRIASRLVTIAGRNNVTGDLSFMKDTKEE
jgi:hypothetical protein